MNVVIDNNSGFCFGVINAIQTAEKHLSHQKQLFCLGDIVHNSEEVERLTRLGLTVISHKEFLQLHDTHVLIRAHGEPPQTYQYANSHNIHLIDATCHVVLKLQQKIREKSIQNPDTQILIFGKNGHAEVVGLLGQIRHNGIVISDTSDINRIDFSRPAFIFAQTTQNLDTYKSVIQDIKERYIQAGNSNLFESFDTICRNVAHRAQQIQEFASQFNLIVFVSGIKSSNGLYLYDICKKANPETYFISHPEEVLQLPINEHFTIGVCGATSTPMWLMQKIKENIEKHFSKQL